MSCPGLSNSPLRTVQLCAPIRTNGRHSRFWHKCHPYYFLTHQSGQGAGRLFSRIVSICCRRVSSGIPLDALLSKLDIMRFHAVLLALERIDRQGTIALVHHLGTCCPSLKRKRRSVLRLRFRLGEDLVCSCTSDSNYWLRKEEREKGSILFPGRPLVSYVSLPCKIEGNDARKIAHGREFDCDR
jgi:hypothetical protein